LRLHDDSELAEFAGKEVISRDTLHEWPMSHVERVTLADGQTLIYKAQIGRGIEAAFYRDAVSPNIPRCLAWAESGGDSWLLLEDVPGEKLAKLPANEAWEMCQNLRHLVEGVVTSITLAQDMSSSGIEDYIHQTAALLISLRARGKLPKLTTAHVDAYLDAINNAEARGVAAENAVLLQGDFKPANFIIRPDGTPIIIDWAAAMRGPAGIDLADFMAESGHDPVAYVGVGAELLRLGRTIRWFADCQDKWISDAHWFDDMIIGLIRRMEHLAQTGSYEGEMVYAFG